MTSTLLKESSLCRQSQGVSFLLTLCVHDGQPSLCTKKSRQGGTWDLRTFSGRALLNKSFFGDCETEEISQIGLGKPSATLSKLPVFTFS